MKWTTALDERIGGKGFGFGRLTRGIGTLFLVLLGTFLFFVVSKSESESEEMPVSPVSFARVFLEERDEDCLF